MTSINVMPNNMPQIKGHMQTSIFFMHTMLLSERKQYMPIQKKINNHGKSMNTHTKICCCFFFLIGNHSEKTLWKINIWMMTA